MPMSDILARHAPVDLEARCRGPVFVPDTPAARANRDVFALHLAVEWASDIEATMATMHPDAPFQAIPALGVAVAGTEGVRRYYLDRFDTWPGPAMDHFDRITVADTCVIVEGTLEVAARGKFAGAGGDTFRAPVVIVVDCRDGLILGETIYVDGTALNAPPDGDQP